jgi:hypothetical protein
MRKWVVTGIVSLFAVAIARLVLTTQSDVDGDVNEYIAGLNYKFRAKVDSVVQTHEGKGVGFLYCRLTEGVFNPAIENELGTRLKEHKRLRVIFPISDSTFRVFLGGINKFAPSDSVIVDSGIDRFAVFRGNECIWEARVRDTTVGKVSFAFWLPD